MKRAQMQINETVLVLLVIALLFIAGMFAYFQYSSSKISRLASTLSEQEATILLNSFLHLPEVACDHRDCLDTGKFLPFANLVAQDMGYYSLLLGAKTITVSQVYPASTPGLCTLATYSSPDYPSTCDTWVVYDNQPRDITQRVVISTPVSLSWPETEYTTLGRVDFVLYA